MDHADHVALIRAGVEGAGRRWLELGAGEGAFTLALAELLGPGGEIVALDRDAAALRKAVGAVGAADRGVSVKPVVADFVAGLPAGPFDGVLAANSLHFVRDRDATLRSIRSALGPGGHLVVVEYDTDRGKAWVPHPFSLEAWRKEAVAAGFDEPRLLHRVPSRFLGAIYGAVAIARKAELGTDPPDPLGAGRSWTPCYTPALTAETERSRAGSATERARDGASRAGTTDPKVAREPCGRRPIARREEARSGCPR